MKKIKFLAFASLVLTLAFSNVALGQYDDLYYDPDRDAGTYYTTTGADRTQPADNAVASRYDDEEADYDNNMAGNARGYDDDDYEYYEDYDYYYTSRVRRFHRPYYGFSYFDPIYADLYYYDPFINPGVTVLIYDGYSSWNSWNSWRRWNRWNSWGSFNRGWGGGWGNGWNDPWYGGGWNRWNDPWYGNNYYVNNYYGYGGGWNNWGGNGYYCPPSWGNGYNYNTINTNNNTHYGPRTTGSTRVPRKNDRSPGIDKPETGPLTPKEERRTYVPGSGVTTPPGNARDTRKPAMEDGKKPAGLDGVGSPETPSRATRPEVQDRNPVIERPTRDETSPSRPKFDEPRTPRRETVTPSREESAPSRPSIDNTRTPRREEASPSRSRQEETRPSTPTRRDDTPAREYRERSSTPERNSSSPSRSYDNSSRQSSPSRSNDSGGSRQSAPSRSNDNGGKSRSGGRNGG